MKCSTKTNVLRVLNLLVILGLCWWIKTKNSNIIKKLEILKSHLNNYIQPRLAWEVTLLNIAHEDL